MRGTSIALQHCASRCGVFANQYIQPLLNQAQEEGYSGQYLPGHCWTDHIRPGAGDRSLWEKLLFWGRPSTFLNGLKDRFVKTLKLNENEAVYFRKMPSILSLWARLIWREKANIPTIIRWHGSEQSAVSTGAFVSLFIDVTKKSVEWKDEDMSVEELDMDMQRGCLAGD